MTKENNAVLTIKTDLKVDRYCLLTSSKFLRCPVSNFVRHKKNCFRIIKVSNDTF